MCYSYHTPFFYYRNFDQWLKERDPSFGVRDIEDVVALAEASDLELVERVEMPANNLSLLYQRK